MRTVALVGQPNVGKSLLMNRLTGIGAFVSNYPGTTVEITRGKLQGKPDIEIIDTPGTYSLRSYSPEQQVTQKILLHQNIDCIVNVVDATNLARNLNLTIELLDFGIPLVVALNQCDRLAQLGMLVDSRELSRLLGVRAYKVSAYTREGIEDLVAAITASEPPPHPVSLGQMEAVIGDLIANVFNERGLRFPRVYAVAAIELGEKAIELGPERLRRSWDSKLADWVESRTDSRCEGCAKSCNLCAGIQTEPATIQARRAIANDVAASCVRRLGRRSARNSRESPVAILLAMGITIWLALAAVSSAINVSERWAAVVFRPVQAWLTGLLARVLGEGAAATLVAHALSEGLMVPFGTVMPAMVMVYAVIALLEDSGFLSRFSTALDPLTSGFGLPGQGAIPLALGLGCRNPAVLATRLLPGKRERTIAIALLDIAVPCAATTGVVTAVISRFGAFQGVIAFSIAVAFIGLGTAANAFLPGERVPLAIEVPPLRLPSLSNVVNKTWSRLRGFFDHVLPMLVGLNVAVRFLVDCGLVRVPAEFGSSTMALLGVRAEVLAAVLTTAVQRYLAPVVLLNLDLSPREATIACVMVCLSFPCAPCTVLTVREIGIRRTAGIFCLGALLPLAAAFFLNAVLP